jgi:hypothetical protein
MAATIAIGIVEKAAAATITSHCSEVLKPVAASASTATAAPTANHLIC